MKRNLQNLIVKILNAQMIQKSYIFQKKMRITECFLNILWDEGYILGYKDSKNQFKIFLKYNNEEPVIKLLRIVSKSSEKKYYSVKQIWKIDSTRMFLIISTSKGLKSISDCKKENIGGEPLLLIK